MTQYLTRFKACYEVANLFLNGGERFCFSARPAGFEIILTDALENASEANLEVIQSVEISDKRRAMLQLLEGGQLPEGSHPDPADNRVSPGGTFVPGTILTLDYLPNSLQELYHERRRSIHDVARRVLGLLRWRAKRWVDYKLIGRPGLFWEGDDHQFHRFPSYLTGVKGLRVEVGMASKGPLVSFVTRFGGVEFVNL